MNTTDAPGCHRKAEKTVEALRTGSGPGPKGKGQEEKETGERDWEERSWERGTSRGERKEEGVLAWEICLQAH